MDAFLNARRTELSGLPYSDSDTVLSLDINDFSDAVRDFNLVIYDKVYGDPATARKNGAYEIVRVDQSETDGNDITVSRGEEGTTAIDFTTGTTWEVLMTPTTQLFISLFTDVAVSVDNLSALMALDTTMYTKALVGGFYEDGDFGDEIQYKWKPNRAKSDHDGWSTINPNHLSTIGSANWYTSDGDSTDDSGNGCWVRPVNHVRRLDLRFFGVNADVTDNYASIVSALDYAETAGIIDIDVPSGLINVETTINLNDWVTDFSFRGAGKFETILKINTDDSRVFTAMGSTGQNYEFYDMTLRGRWADNPHQSTGDDWLISMRGHNSLTLNNCRFVSSQKGLVKAGRANGVLSTTKVSFCDFEEAARGGLNITGCSNVSVGYNSFKHLVDDAVSIHTPETLSDPNSNSRVTNNDFFDCQGIACLGAKNLVISNNTGKLLRGRFAYIGASSSFGEGHTSQFNISITDNVISDIINNSAFGLGDNNRYLDLGVYYPSDGATLSAPPFEADPSGGIVPFYGNAWNVGDRLTNVMAGTVGVIVSGNTFQRTLAPATNYSDYGFGEYITFDGYEDGEIEEGDLRGEIFLDAGMRDFTICHNFFRMGDRGLFFNFNADSEEIGFRNGKVYDNTFSDHQNAIVNTNASASGTNILDIEFRNNLIDGDPFYRHSERSNDGSWTNIGDLYGLNLANTIGAKINGNRFRNVSRAVFGAGGTFAFTGKNFLECDPVTTGFSTSNKGLGRVEVMGEKWGFIHIDCDTTSSTFGQILRGTPIELSSIPTSGKYVKGEFIYNNASESREPDSNEMLLTGWKRRTTGTNHNVGTDWELVYAPTESV